MNGGVTGVYIYKNQGGYGFFDQSGKYAQANSQTSLIFATNDKINTVTDQFGQTLYVIPAGKPVTFKATGTVNPNNLFAGSYYASLLSIWANPNTTDISSSYSIQVPDNKTDRKTIVGEVSPYISQIVNTNPISVGTPITVRGTHLGETTVAIDGITQNVKISSNSQVVVNFKLPAIQNGQHYLTLTNRDTGTSNRVYFESINGANQPGAVLVNTSATLGSAIVNQNKVVGYQATFKFTLVAGNSTLFVSTSTTDSGILAQNASVTFGAKGFIVPTSRVMFANPGQIAGDTANYFVVPAGSSREFTVNGVLLASQGIPGLNTAQIISIGYGTNPNNLTSSQITSGLDNLKLSAQF